MIRKGLAGIILVSSVVVAFPKDYVLHSFEKHKLTGKFYCEGANYGDFNRDGHDDVVSGPFWYEGPRFQKRHEIYTPKAFDGRDGYSDDFLTFVYDFNQDGWPDVLVIGFPGKAAFWYENPKGRDVHWARHQAFDQVDNESPWFTDLTGDGRPEIVCNSRGYFGYAEPDWAHPDRPWTFHPITPKGGWQRFTHGLGVGDVNGDGRRDVLDKDGWWEQPASLEGDPVWKRHLVHFGQGGAQMLVYDVNGDGLNDVITSIQAHGYGLAWFQQIKANGTTHFKEHLFMNIKPQENKYGIEFTEMHALALADIDGDGLMDIVTGKRFWAHGPHGDPEAGKPAVLYWFQLVRHPDGTVDYVPHLIDDNSGVGTQVVAADITGDGRPDIVVGNKKGTFVFIQRARKVSRQEWEAAQPVPVNP